MRVELINIYEQINSQQMLRNQINDTTVNSQPVGRLSLSHILFMVLLSVSHHQQTVFLTSLVYLTKFVIARISGSFLYGFASCESNGLIPDFINMLASTRYFKQVVRLNQ